MLGQLFLAPSPLLSQLLNILTNEFRVELRTMHIN